MERGYPAGTVDEYLAAVPEEQRAALESVRRVILDAIPDGSERIGYQIPMFEYHRRGLVGLSFADGYCCLHLMSPPLARAVAGFLDEGELLVCTVHFTADRPLGEATVRRIVAMRVAEVDAAAPLAAAR
jgi:uncharacterized protein YdhG (YjbR/CyaY superfamily)